MKSLKSLFENKKGALALGQIPGAVLIIFYVGIILGVTLLVLANFLGKMTANTTAYYAVNDTIEGIAEFSGWIGIIVLMIVVAVILGLVYMFQVSRH